MKRRSNLVSTAHFTGTSGTPDSVTSYFMGGQYEVKDGATKKYYSIAGMTVAMQDASGLQYLLTDHLGSTVAVTNASGTLTSQQRYLPFGGVRSIPNSPILATDFGYTGQRLLDAGMGGIMDYKARFYSPYLNRFLQPDTIIPDQSNPQSWNRNSYVQNNPVRFNDPTGHMLDDGCRWIGCGGGPSTPPPSNPPVDLDLLLGLHPNTCTTNTCSLPAATMPSVGLHPNSCTTNTCSVPPASAGNSNSGGSDSNYCLPETGTSCQIELPIDNMRFDIGGVYIMSEGSVSVSIYNPNGSVVISNSGVTFNGTLSFEDTVEFAVVTAPIDLGANGHGTFSSGIGFTDLYSGMAYVEYSLSTPIHGGPYSAESAGRIEVGVRPVIAILELAIIKVGADFFRTAPTFPSLPVPGPVY